MIRSNTFFAVLILFSAKASFVSVEIQCEKPKPRAKAEGNLLTDLRFDSALSERRISEVSRTKSLIAATNLKEYLFENNLNIATAESLTAGMIAKTLVDVPGEGKVVYGGAIVYDTDAKRKYINVETKGVYSVETAKQMAKGILENSRAMVSVAVSGDSMPYPDLKEELGIVYIGVGLRLEQGNAYFGTKIEICKNPNAENLCNAWKELNQGGDNKKFAPYQFTAYVADYIRTTTVTQALLFVQKIVEKHINAGVVWQKLKNEDYDYVCRASGVIYSRAEKETNADWCHEKDTSSIHGDQN